MPVYGDSSITTPGFRRRPAMPKLPRTVDDVVPYLSELDQAVVDATDEERRRLLFYVGQRGTVAFGASDTAKAVTLAVLEADTDYDILVSAPWHATFVISSLATTGFTVTASGAPGGSGGTVKWVLVR